MNASSCLYAGSVKHYRTRPKRHVLQYKLFSFLLDLSELDTLDTRLKVFSRNRFNLFSFRDTDFGLPGMSLRGYVCEKLRNAGIADQPSQILLLCSPRMLGYSFNPLGVFYCYNERSELYATIYEVHNTFGERHSYVLEAQQVAGTPWIQQFCDKAMYVSPFVPADMAYKFNLKAPTDRLALSIKVGDKHGTMVGAVLQGRRREMSDSLLLRYFFTYPLMTIKVIAGIHYEALKLWFKGVEWFKYLPKSRLQAKQSGER